MEFQWKTLAPWKKSYDKPRQHIKNQRHYFANRGPYNQSYGVSSSHYRCERWTIKKGWAPKNWCFWIVVFQKSLESPLDCREIKVNPKGNQPWIFIRRTNAEAVILWPPDAKSWLIIKNFWCWKKLKVEEEGDDRGWDGWMALPTQCTWVWANSGRLWRIGRPGVLHAVHAVAKSWTQLTDWTTMAMKLQQG